MSLEDHFAVWNVLGELAEVIAGYSLDCVIIRAEAIVYQHFNKPQIILIGFELPCILLPELLLMAWSPSELLPFNLFLKLLNRTVNFLILLEVSVEIFKHLVNIIINPVTVLQLDNQVEGIDL